MYGANTSQIEHVDVEIVTLVDADHYLLQELSDAESEIHEEVVTLNDPGLLSSVPDTLTASDRSPKSNLVDTKYPALIDYKFVDPENYDTDPLKLSDVEVSSQKSPVLTVLQNCLVICKDRNSDSKVRTFFVLIQSQSCLNLLIMLCFI